METIIKNTAENFGGTLTILFIPVEDVLTIPAHVNKEITDPIVLVDGKEFFQMQHRLESINYDEVPGNLKEGEEYTIKVTGFIPGDRPQTKALLERMQHRRYILICTDANKYMRLLGTIENGLRFSYKFGINPKISGGKGYEITFQHKNFETPPFYLSNFIYAEAPDVLYQPHIYLYDERLTIKDLTDSTKAMEFVVDAVPTGTTKKIYMANDDVYLQDLLDLRDSNLIAVTPAQLQTLIDDSELKPGRFYNVSIYSAIVQAISTTQLSPLGVRLRTRPKFETYSLWNNDTNYNSGDKAIELDTVYNCIATHYSGDHLISDPDYWTAIASTDLTYYVVTPTKIVFTFASEVLNVHTEEFTDGNYVNLLKDWATAQVFLKDSYRIYNGKLVRALVSHKTGTYATDLASDLIEEIVGNNAVDTYPLAVIHASTNPVDGETRYFSDRSVIPQTSETNSRIYADKKMRITAAQIHIQTYSTAGSNEDWSLYIRKNNTTDYLIATVSNAAAIRIFRNDALDIPLEIGDYISVKSVQPTWTTNPLSVQSTGWLRCKDN